MKIPEIFEIKGEEYFRNCESECLFEISKNSGILVATGGGIVKRKKNVDIMKNSGKIVYINTPPEVILKNSALENRPLLKDKSEIFKLYESRKELYLSAADFVIENVGTISEAAQKIENIFS